MIFFYGFLMFFFNWFLLLSFSVKNEFSGGKDFREEEILGKS